MHDLSTAGNSYGFTRTKAWSDEMWIICQIYASLPGCSPHEINLVKKLLSLNPTSRATAMELLHDKYRNEENLPIQVSELRVLLKHTDRDDDSSGEWGDYRNIGLDLYMEGKWDDYRDIGSYSYMEDFGPTSVTNSNGFSIQFS
ncbi:hypothetical protein LIER_38939 [Lithospermum erythrorhizon]|uniref:Uncharacterized protein n=1 Tax=Lithospermum erythrorhizon TaxID=34254 RepID=A0AAV3QB85_LITER